MWTYVVFSRGTTILLLLIYPPHAYLVSTHITPIKGSLTNIALTYKKADRTIHTRTGLQCYMSFCRMRDMSWNVLFAIEIRFVDFFIKSAI